MSRDSQKLSHLFYPVQPTGTPFQKRTGRGPTTPLPPRNRGAHGQGLKTAYSGALTKAEQHVAERLAGATESMVGYYLEFSLRPDEWEILKSLDSSGVELVSVKQLEGDGNILATAFIPKNKSAALENKITKYITEDTKPRTEGGIPKPRNAKLVEAIDSIDLGQLQSLWQDSADTFPAENETIWWEVWLPIREDRLQLFYDGLTEYDISFKDGRLTFPDRIVIMVNATPILMDKLMWQSGAIAELRRVKVNSGFFLALNNEEQLEWIEDLVARIIINQDTPIRICLFDTGVNRGHSLLSDALSEADMTAYSPDWPIEDVGEGKHGTLMAGLSVYGDLSDPLSHTEEIQINHKLESIRILPPRDINPPDLYGVITQESISRIETINPNYTRCFCMAITSDFDVDRGKPSAWSAAIDQSIFNFDRPSSPRLFLVSAGNIRDFSANGDYLTACDISQVEDPAQAWNALTIGAYTEKDVIEDPTFQEWVSGASSGALSPVSRTSVTWDRRNWPIKPEVVFEGGNWAKNPNTENPYWEPIAELGLLTTHHAISNRQLSVMDGTSASTALAAKFVAELQAAYPETWAETIRGMVIHSAEWTPQMITSLNACHGKTDRANQLRRFGYGVPSSEKALWSASNDLTLIIESEIQPFIQARTGDPKINVMNLHALPWPTAELQRLGAANIKLKVTLSYFVEPNPSERGYRNKFTYQSHGLRFNLKRAGETLAQFTSRINKADEDNATGGLNFTGGTTNEDNWKIGSNTRDVGSIHCDIWEGSAADLADREAIAIYPVGGWWKYLKNHGKANSNARYSLILSIETDEQEADLYAHINAIIQTEIAATIEV